MSTHARTPIGPIRWRCRRGMKELDVLLGRFMENAYESLNVADNNAFERLLNAADQDIFGWISGQITAPDAALERLAGKIRQCTLSAQRDGAAKIDTRHD